MPTTNDTSPRWEVADLDVPGRPVFVTLSIAGQHIGGASPSRAYDGLWGVAASGFPVCYVAGEEAARQFLLKLGELVTGERYPAELAGYTACEGADAEAVSL